MKVHVRVGSFAIPPVHVYIVTHVHMMKAYKLNATMSCRMMTAVSVLEYRSIIPNQMWAELIKSESQSVDIVMSSSVLSITNSIRIL